MQNNVSINVELSKVADFDEVKSFLTYLYAYAKYAFDESVVGYFDCNFDFETESGWQEFLHVYNELRSESNHSGFFYIDKKLWSGNPKETSPYLPKLVHTEATHDSSEELSVDVVYDKSSSSEWFDVVDKHLKLKESEKSSHPRDTFAESVFTVPTPDGHKISKEAEALLSKMKSTQKK